MRVITEHTYGSHIFMRLELDSGEIAEIDVMLRSTGEYYETSADDDEKRRLEIIDAFNQLY